MDCWKCDRQISEQPIKIGFRAVCIHCGIDLHVCKNCRYYSPGKPNDCAVPGTEFIRDREAFNFCKNSSLRSETSPQPRTTRRAGSKKIFTPFSKTRKIDERKSE